MPDLIRQNTNTRLVKNNLPEVHLLPTLSYGKVRTKEEIARRNIVLFALKSISLYPDDFQDIKKWLHENLQESLSPNEKQALHELKLSTESEIRYSWHQESMYVLLWCLSIAPHLSEPNKEADVSSYLELFPPEETISNFENLGQLRDLNELQQELDYYYNLHWLSRHRSGLTNEAVSRLNKSVILERRKTLEWVLNKTLLWDDVNLDT